MSNIPDPGTRFFSALGLIPLSSTSKDLAIGNSTPLLRQRILMLTDHADTTEWLKYLTWNTSEADRLEFVISQARRLDAVEKFLGYGCLDQETYLSYFEVNVQVNSAANLEVSLYVTLCLTVDEPSNTLHWQLHEVNLTMPAAPILVQQSSELEELLAERRGSFIGTKTAEQILDIDYWNKYDQLSETSSASASRSIVPSEDFYDRYDTIEAALDPPSRAKTASSTAVVQIPDIVYHLENSLRSLQTLAGAANIDSEQFLAICQRVTRAQVKPFK